MLCLKHLLHQNVNHPEPIKTRLSIIILIRLSLMFIIEGYAFSDCDESSRCLIFSFLDVTSARKERKLSRRVPWVKYFELDVPEDTFPPNFHSDHGYIRNDVTVTLKLKGGKEHVTSRPFKIIDVTSLATHFEDGQRSCSQVCW